jgi:hypothetical protein
VFVVVGSNFKKLGGVGLKLGVGLEFFVGGLWGE